MYARDVAEFLDLFDYGSNLRILRIEIKQYHRESNKADKIEKGLKELRGLRAKELLCINGKFWNTKHAQLSDERRKQILTQNGRQTSKEIAHAGSASLRQMSCYLATMLSIEGLHSVMRYTSE